MLKIFGSNRPAASNGRSIARGCGWFFAVVLVLSVVVVVGTPSPAAHATATASLSADLTSPGLTGTPYLFGGSKFPQQAQLSDAMPKLANAGINRIRTDMYLEKVVPTTTVANYNANVNNVQDPSTWDWSLFGGQAAAQQQGIGTMMVADYVPPWLSYSGQRKGVPMDWTIWEDLVKKVFLKYQSSIQWLEVFNEPELNLDITGSPYTTRAAALAAMYYHTVRAVRSTGSTVPIGGFAFTYDDTTLLNTTLQDMVTSYGQSWVTANLNFYSFHSYGSAPANFDANATRTILTNNGVSASTPIYVDEYNITANWQGTNPELSTASAIGFVGKALAGFVNEGVGADYFSFYPYNYTLSNTGYENGVKTTLAIYWVSSGQPSVANMFSQTYPMRILSTQLGLGNGSYAVKPVTTSVIDGTAAVNASGHSVVFLSNYYNNSNSVTVTVDGLPGTTDHVVEYLGSSTNDGSTPYTSFDASVQSGSLTTTISMPANSVVGLDLGNTGNAGASVSGPIISGVASNLCVDDQAGNTANGTKISLWGCDGNSNQSLSYVTASTGNTLQVLGKCLQAAGDGTTNGTPIQLYTCGSGDSGEIWALQSNGSFMNPQSGRCLDDPSGSTAGGVQLTLSDCGSGTDQKFHLP